MRKELYLGTYNPARRGITHDPGPDIYEIVKLDFSSTLED